jgi:hypothetical protein
LQSLMNQHFPIDQSLMLQNHAQGKDPSKMQKKKMNFNVTKCSLIKLHIDYSNS